MQHEPSSGNRLVASLTLENRRLRADNDHLSRALRAARREKAEIRRLWAMTQELHQAAFVRLLAVTGERDELRQSLEAARRELRLQVGPAALARNP